MSDVPAGTKPWRKSWRKRWREGSTFRHLSPLAKLAVQWVEDNADDEGVATVTVRQMADAIGGWHHKQQVAVTTMWRAWKEASDAGLLSIVAGQASTPERNGSPSKLTRINFKAYQEREERSETGSETGMTKVAELSSRGTQRTEKTSSRGGAERAEERALAFAGIAHAGIPLDPTARTFLAKQVNAGLAACDAIVFCVLGAATAEFRNPMKALSADGRRALSKNPIEVASARSDVERWIVAQRNRDGGGARRGAGPAPALQAIASGLPEDAEDDAPHNREVHRDRRPAGHVQNDLGLGVGQQPGLFRSQGPLGRA